MLSNLPQYDPKLFTVFNKLQHVRGQLVVENNDYVYNLDFLSQLRTVC